MTTAINTARGSTEVHPFRRPQSWYNNRVKPGLPMLLAKTIAKNLKLSVPTVKVLLGYHVNYGPAMDTPDIADFIKHLKTVHGNISSADQLAAANEQIQATITLTGERELAQIAGDCHIPKYHGGAFWCGFCRKVIKLNGKMRLEEPSPGKAPGVSSAKDVEESSDEEDGDADFNESSPRDDKLNQHVCRATPGNHSSNGWKAQRRNQLRLRRRGIVLSSLRQPSPLRELHTKTCRQET
ncbi:hypothetical protein L211DRAFT_848539 [Terfezia boudieri ATCC MYA-4762]|uniref:Uncharacterized protein n=1 Tax=Terfezia boudieri ATCC MYA-4762 TaxID=1051890 RepID=A0A3N4LP90_9PEZI|nr:hypothetical protein L211DRAFT_848539 [Terfezia boudieri ATCC MYA-4762]